MDSDGQQIQFQLISSQQDGNYNDDDYNQYQCNSIAHFFYSQDDHHKKQDAPTGILQDKPYILNDQSSGLSQENKNTQGLFQIKQQRNKNYIEISRKTKEKYVICKKGNKRQTSLLNINFKNFLSTLLREYLMFNKTNAYEEQKIQEFFKAKANFGSFQKLYGVEEQIEQKDQNGNGEKELKTCLKIKRQHDRLRKFLLKKFQTGDYVSKILINRKMSYQNKISIMKFASQIRKSCINPQNFKNWKTSNIC